ncbi:MAG: hypothetical protein HN842_08235 [Gammaproteobacteria bacterium]|nr:hypothetical protein [Gammaproteobacteria bacterium]
MSENSLETAAANLTINIDGQEIKLNDLSDAARSQLTNMQAVDRQIADIQQQLAIMQTARNAYATALKGEIAVEH